MLYYFRRYSLHRHQGFAQGTVDRCTCRGELCFGGSGGLDVDAQSIGRSQGTTVGEFVVSGRILIRL
jgi:hypothetical protein